MKTKHMITPTLLKQFRKYVKSCSPDTIFKIVFQYVVIEDPIKIKYMEEIGYFKNNSYVINLINGKNIPYFLIKSFRYDIYTCMKKRSYLERTY